MNFKKIKHIHFIGIGGSGMIGIARVLLKKGYKISGSDINNTTELKKLKKSGAKVYIGHRHSNINNANLIVVSSAIDLKNPEIIEAKKNSITIIPRAEMLGSLMKGYESIAIAGSHGKTTTTSMIAKIFTVSMQSPTYVVGGKVLSTDENSDLGDGKHLIAEADESDGSFIHLQPDVAVLTNIDDDHLVHYDNNFENLLSSFVRFSENVPFYGYLIINTDDKNIKKISKRISRKQISFGKSSHANYQIQDPSYNNGWQFFKIKKNEKIYKFKIQLPGVHNVYNAAAAIAVSMEEGIPLKAIKEGIAKFSGVGRRYEKHEIYIKPSYKVLIDDYGHHPIEVLSTIKAYKEEFPKSRSLMIFQPHRFSRTAQLFDDFIKVLKKVDSVVLLDIYAASEKPIKGIDSRTIVETLKQQGHKDVTYLKNHNDINALIKQRRDDFDILITQGAGSVSIVCNSIIGKWKV
ncbi:UDP-N-acetylmuramate--L-alanine ligase [Gammaproteobacteria bacterium]|nr:UDP-N-acetylmuramate--L-alanine ligase [Gammaproteobacteria bacterium]